MHILGINLIIKYLIYYNLALFRFENSEDARKAEAENGELFREHHLRVHCCESNEKPDESKAIFVGNIAFSKF